MAYNKYEGDRVIPQIPIQKSYTSYMKVEAVLRWMNKKALALPQYTITGFQNHFFLASDVATKMTPAEFRKMECDVTQYLIEDK